MTMTGPIDQAEFARQALTLFSFLFFENIELFPSEYDNTLQFHCDVLILITTHNLNHQW